MDPGHPTIPYNGPYNPDYKPTHPTIEDVFHLTPHSEKPLTPTKEKASKTKPDAKKPVEPIAKPHKDDYFPGPLAPDKFLNRGNPINANENHQFIPGPLNPNKLPPVQKVGHGAGQTQFVPLGPQQGTVGPGFPITSINNEQAVQQVGFNEPPLDNPAAVGPPYRGPMLNGPDTVDPNVIVPVSPKKKTSPNDGFDVEKGKLSGGLAGRPKQGQRNPEQEILPEELYHLINLQHPGLVRLEHGPPEGHPGLYDIHQQISGQKPTANNQIQPGYFAPTAAGPKKATKPHIYAQKNENGQTTYHIHTPDIPNSPQQIEQLLAHISQHDPNPGPFQHYPGQPGGPTDTLPIHIDDHIPHSGLTHLNHPFAAQTPNQSGSSPMRNFYFVVLRNVNRTPANCKCVLL